MRETPRPAASTKNKLSPAEAELQLAAALRDGVCADPFGQLGPHETGGGGHFRLRAWLPGSAAVTVLARGTREPLAGLKAVDGSGLFAGDVVLEHRAAYLLQVDANLGSRVIEDPYRFGPWLGKTDVWLLNEGRHLRPWEKLGAHLCTVDGVAGVAFAVWAPNARQVSLAGDFNLWISRCHPMRLRVECGVWEIFIPELAPGALYKFDVLGADGLRQLKSDPFALGSGLLQDEGHAGIHRLVRDLNHLYRSRPALHERDDEPAAFSWTEVNDSANSVFGFLRNGHAPGRHMLVACNFTPVPRHGYRMGVPIGGVWRACLNTDSAHYAGSGMGNLGAVRAEAVPVHGMPMSLNITLPPLAVLWFEPEAGA